MTKKQRAMLARIIVAFIIYIPLAVAEHMEVFAPKGALAWLALYLILCFLQDHGVGLITTEYELRYILYLRGFERTLLDRAQENGCNALWAEGE